MSVPCHRETPHCASQFVTNVMATLSTGDSSVDVNLQVKYADGSMLYQTSILTCQGRSSFSLREIFAEVCQHVVCEPWEQLQLVINSCEFDSSYAAISLISPVCERRCVLPEERMEQEVHRAVNLALEERMELQVDEAVDVQMNKRSFILPMNVSKFDTRYGLSRPVVAPTISGFGLS